MYTTLNKAKTAAPCTENWDTMLQHLGKTEADDEALPILTILNTCGIDAALWALQTVTDHDDVLEEFTNWCIELSKKEKRTPQNKNVGYIAGMTAYIFIRRKNQMEKKLRKILEGV